MRSALIVVLLCSAHAATYYVDCGAGSDAAPGTSPAAAWGTLARVSATTFVPGDAVLLRRGTKCRGTLWPKGSGADHRPIRVGAYGEGPLPKVDAAGADAAVKLEDQQYWVIENLDASGGSPYGVWIGAGGGRTLRHFVLRNLVVHDVGGTPKRKASGLVVISASGAAGVEDILIDGVTATSTSQWAGIFVSGSETRARHVTIRNSIVHDVAGDGIVVFAAEDAVIEKCAAWHTGLQERETIGTPNAIWTWMCRRCTVENNEGFWIDSPGVDGGVYDIDWGDEDNVVRHNYAHDAQGYCAAIFGAGRGVTVNSAIVENVCVNNGRSPKLARRQGDIYTSTWDGGSLDGIAIERNTIIWNPPIDAPALQMSDTAFSGTRPNLVAGNVVWSAVRTLANAAAPVRFEDNTWWYAGRDTAQWCYGPRGCAGVAAWHEIAPRDRLADPGVNLLRPAPSSHGLIPVPLRRSGRWMLLLFARQADPDARSQIPFLEAALAQYRDAGLDAVLVSDHATDLQYDWNLGAIEVIQPGGFERALGIRTSPTLLLVSPSSEIVSRWDGFAAPSALGIALKYYLGPGPGNPPLPEFGHRCCGPR